MQRKILLCICLCMLVVCSVIWINNKLNTESDYENTGRNGLKCLYYNESDFINIDKINNYDDIGAIGGIIVPHHLIAKDLIHEAMGYAGKSNYKNIVVFGPDHKSEDKGKVFTSYTSWQTPYGYLDTDTEILDNIIKLDFVLSSDEKLTVEHSIAGLVPFIKYYFSDADIIPLVLTKQLTLENIDTLLKTIYDNINAEETLFIASVDFSHYLDLDNANKMDEISIKAIMNKSYEQILQFTNDNLDSPNSIIAMLKIMELTGCNRIKLLNRSNSEIILNKKVKETTSYVTFLFFNDK